MQTHGGTAVLRRDTFEPASVSMCAARNSLLVAAFTGAGVFAAMMCRGQDAPGVAGGFDSLNTRKVAVSLVPESKTVSPAGPFTVALKLNHAPGVHTYWINPGVGKATELSWQLPDGWKASPLLWPIPHAKPGPLGHDHVYEGIVYLLTTLTPPESFADGSEAVLKARATWLECDAKGCVDQQVDLEVKVAAGTPGAPDATLKTAFDRVRAEQPKNTPAWEVAAVDSPQQYVITLKPGPDANPDPGAIYFFDRNAALANESPKIDKPADGSWRLTIEKSDEEKPPDGFLHAANGWHADKSVPALLVPAAGSSVPSIPPATGPTPAESTPPDSPPQNGSIPPETLRAMDEIIPSSGPKHVSVDGTANEPLTYWWALLFAFVGGFILNAMPCVFPVLGIKILGFVNQAGENPGKVRKHGVIFAAGLLVSLWALAGVLIGLNLAGQRLGWGFQQQSPGFSIFIIAVLFLLGLNLAGVFEVGTSLTTVGGELMSREGYAGSFFTGVLTTLVATPCSGPFLGAAMGYTLQQPPLPALVLFTAFGLGIAVPYVVLSLFPRLINRLPRPGPWMETFKVILAFPMFATVIYFLNAFAAQTGSGGVTSALLVLLFLAAAVWIYGKWCAPIRPPPTRLKGALATAGMAALAVWQAVIAARQQSDAAGYEKEIAALNAELDAVILSGGKLSDKPPGTSTAGLKWQSWSPERVRDLRREGRILFADFTAKW
jgi:DsbC/DsbD-like thiol-disulfide interchange protein/cytochrome c biogenesis protein CcdA